MNIRPYQLDVIDEITTEAASGKRRIILQAPTGSGKTIIAAQIISHAVSNKKHVLFLAHRRELIWQTMEKLESFGVPHGVLIAGEPYDPTHFVSVASIGTIFSRAMRRKVIGLPKADLVICDEFHHAASSGTWKKILEEYKNSFILGLTATPINVLGFGMGHVADRS